jgi:hypothetical protein
VDAIRLERTCRALWADVDAVLARAGAWVNGLGRAPPQSSAPAQDPAAESLRLQRESQKLDEALRKMREELDKSNQAPQP